MYSLIDILGASVIQSFIESYIHSQSYFNFFSFVHCQLYKETPSPTPVPITFTWAIHNPIHIPVHNTHLHSQPLHSQSQKYDSKNINYVSIAWTVVGEHIAIFNNIPNHNHVHIPKSQSQSHS